MIAFVKLKPYTCEVNKSVLYMIKLSYVTGGEANALVDKAEDNISPDTTVGIRYLEQALNDTKIQTGFLSQKYIVSTRDKGWVRLSRVTKIILKILKSAKKTDSAALKSLFDKVRFINSQTKRKSDELIELERSYVDFKEKNYSCLRLFFMSLFR